MQLTLNKIRSNSPCYTGWEKLLKSMGKTKADNSRVLIAHLLDSNGINDTLWVISECIPDELEKKRNMVADLTDPAIKAAESVLHIFENKYPGDKRPRNAIENAKENVRRARSGEERLSRKFYYAVAAADAAAAAATAADAAADAVAVAVAVEDAAAVAAAAAYAVAAAATAAYAAAAADAYAAAAAVAAADAVADAYADAAADAYAVAVAAAVAATDAATVAAAATDADAAAARQKSRDNQKQIILKYFGDQL